MGQTYKEVDEIPENWEEVEKDLIVIGMIGSGYPLQDGIKYALGVKVRLLSRSNKNAAITIAKQVEILPSSW